MHDELEHARQAFWGWKTTPLQERIALLEAFAREVEADGELPTLISEEVGKPLWESKQEVKAVVGKVALSIQAMHERASTLTKGNLTLRHLPHGVLGVLGPFNFPAHLPNGHIVPALLAGNTVVFKPSPQAPRVGSHLQTLWKRAGLPKGVLEIVQGGGDVGWALATHPWLNGLLFTGSAQVGLQLSEHYGKYPEKILALEMGGNNPLIFEEVADLHAALLTTLQSAYLTSGQRCSCARRLILIDSPQANPFLDTLIAALDKIRIGKYTDLPEPFMGPVINEAAANRIMTYQEDLIKQGAHPLKPMTCFDNHFLTPGIIETTPLTHKPDTECFGPLLQLIRVPTLRAAVHEAGETRFGLTASILTDNPASFAYARDRIRSGLLNWNAPTTGASSAMPFGGVGLSGNHRPTGSYACDMCAYPMVSNASSQFSPTPIPGLTL